jgi:hypothetical protein
MKFHKLKNLLLIFFFSGITLTSAYSGSFAPKDSAGIKGKKFAKLEKCKDSAKCSGMDKTMKMESKKVSKIKVIDLKAIDQNNDGKVYQCPMDYDVLSDTPGRDPKCGMELKEVTLAQANKNLIDHGFKVK